MSLLTDGFKTTLDFLDISVQMGVRLKEKEIQPPEMDGGGELDTSNMRNNVWRTRQPKKLKTLGMLRLVCLYDPIIYQSLVALINVNTRVRITFPDTHNVIFWGWLNRAAPQNHREGELSLCDLEVIVSNQDDSGVETGPIYA